MSLRLVSVSIDTPTFLLFVATHGAAMKLINLLNCDVDWDIVVGLRNMRSLQLEGVSFVTDPGSVDVAAAKDTTIALEPDVLAYVNGESDTCRSIDGTVIDPEYEGYIRTVNRRDFIDLEDETTFWEWDVFRERDRLRIFIWCTEDTSKNKTEYYLFRYRDNTRFVAEHPYDKYPDWDFDAGDSSQAVPWGKEFDRYLMGMPTCFEPEPDKVCPDHAFEYDLYDNDNPFHIDYY